MPEAAGTTAADTTNLWSKFLQDSSKRARSQESTCLVVGDTTEDREKIIQSLTLSDRDSSGLKGDNKAKSISGKEFVSYGYFDVDDRMMSSPTGATSVNLWAFDSQIFDGACQILRSSSASAQLSIVVVLDLMRPETCLLSLHQWLCKIASFLQQYESDSGTCDQQNVNGDEVPSTASSRKQSIGYYLKYARRYGGYFTAAGAASPLLGGQGPTAAEGDLSGPGIDADSAAAGTAMDFVVENFAVPIIVVGLGVDKAVASTGSQVAGPAAAPNMSGAAYSAKLYRELQGQLRAVCLEVGAALLFPSSSRNDGHSTATNMTTAATAAAGSDAGSGAVSQPAPTLQQAGNEFQELKRYLLHRIYPNQIAMEALALNDSKLECTFIPSGFDTLDLIRISTPGLEFHEGEFREKFPTLQEQVQRQQPQEAYQNTQQQQQQQQQQSPQDLDVEAAENEQDWLARLELFISEVSAAPAGRGGNSTKSISNSNSSSNVNRLAQNLSDTSLSDIARADDGNGTEINNEGLPAEAKPKSAAVPTRATRSSGAAVATGGAGTTAGAAMTRRQSVRNQVASSDQKEVGDFWKNMLKKK